MFAMLFQVASGGATLEEVLPILRERERQSQLHRAMAAGFRTVLAHGQFVSTVTQRIAEFANQSGG